MEDDDEMGEGESEDPNLNIMKNNSKGFQNNN